MLVHEKLKDFYKGFNPDAHPMAILVSVVGALSSFMHDSLDITDPIQREVPQKLLIIRNQRLR